MTPRDAQDWERFFSQLSFSDFGDTVRSARLIQGLSDAGKGAFAEVHAGISKGVAATTALGTAAQATSPGSRTTKQAADVAFLVAMFAGLSNSDLTAVKAAITAVQAERAL